MAFNVSIRQDWFVHGVQTLGPISSPNNELNRSLVVTVFPDWFKRVSLEWKTPKEWGNCNFHVYFWPGGTETGYKRITAAPLTNPYFTDTESQEYSRFRTGSYVVEALLLDRNIKVQSEPTSWKYLRRNFVEKRSAEIQRREYLLLSKFSGTKAYLFRKRNYGERCTRCWNRETEKVMDDHCPVCYGTSFKGGYFDPVPMFMQFEPTPNNLAKTYFGNLEANQIGAWTISVPEINSDDIVLRIGDWNIYKVVRTATTELQTNTVRQMITLTQLSRNDVENMLASRTEEANAEAYVPTVGGKYAKERFPIKQLDTNPRNDPKWFQEMNVSSTPEKYKI